MNGEVGRQHAFDADVQRPISGTPERQRGGCLQRAVAAIKAEDQRQSTSGWQYAEARPRAHPGAAL